MIARIDVSLGMDDLFKLVDQLSPEERKRLSRYMAESSLSAAEKLAVMDSLTFEIPVVNGASYRREDWYGDDGR